MGGFLILCLAGLSWPAAAHADAVTDWNQELQTIINVSSVNLVDGPPEVAREMLIVTASMFDAVNAATGDSYPSYAYNGPPVMGVSTNAAALAAGYQAVVSIFNDPAWQSPTGAATAATVLALTNQYYTNALAGLGVPQNSATTPNLSACGSPSGALISICGGLALGQAASSAVVAKQANDGSQNAILNGLNPYIPPGSGTVPGVYVPPTTRPAMFPQWGSVTPTGLSATTLQQIVAQTIPGPPALNSAAYASGLLQTECAGSGTPLPSSVVTACTAAGIAPETTAQARSALFWNDPGTTNQPPGHWLDITNGVIQSQDLSTLQAARLSMLVSLAENDAGIASWGVKYQYNLWRPITAIRNCAQGSSGSVTWNPYFTSCDSTWTALIATPPHPDYVAGHPAFSGAAATVLANFFGTDNIPVTSVSETYCNEAGDTTQRGPDLQIVACLVPATSIFALNGAPTIYSLPSLSLQAGCTAIGGIYVSGGGSPACIVKGTTYVWSSVQTGCDDIVNGGANDSPLICPITESFSGFSDAASAAEFSRVAGGIHTPFSVTDAFTLGDAVGEAVSSQFNIPEPEAAGALTVSCAVLARLHRRRRSGSRAVTSDLPRYD